MADFTLNPVTVTAGYWGSQVCSPSFVLWGWLLFVSCFCKLVSGWGLDLQGGYFQLVALLESLPFIGGLVPTKNKNKWEYFRSF